MMPSLLRSDIGLGFLSDKSDLAITHLLCGSICLILVRMHFCEVQAVSTTSLSLLELGLATRIELLAGTGRQRAVCEEDGISIGKPNHFCYFGTSARDDGFFDCAGRIARLSAIVKNDTPQEK